MRWSLDSNSLQSSRRLAVAIVVCLLLAVALIRQPGEANVAAQVRSSPRPPAFKSGGARSEIVLREMAATLKSIDARLARIEKTVNQAEQALQRSGAQ